jgi:hypothetical protein
MIVRNDKKVLDAIKRDNLHDRGKVIHFNKNVTISSIRRKDYVLYWVVRRICGENKVRSYIRERGAK